MEITSDNFEANFDLIKESIDMAEFIAIDSEFSGKSPFLTFNIMLGQNVSLDDKGHDYDTVEERYQKTRFACHKF